MATTTASQIPPNVHSSFGNQIGTKMRALAHHGKPDIEINLENSNARLGKWVNSYSTMDTIEGTVSVSATHDTPFELIEITFTGEFRSPFCWDSAFLLTRVC